MSDLNDIVQIVISRDTQSVARSSFGVFAIISEFTTDKTTDTFERYRTYASLAEMVADGWLTTDQEYKAAQLVFSQNPKSSSIMIGRKDSGDASWAVALNAVQAASSNWYVLMIIGTNETKMLFDADFVASNSIVFTINGTAVTAVPYNTSQAQTMADLKTQIEADISGSLVTIDTDDPDTRTLLISVDGTIPTASVVVTGGASQAGSVKTTSTSKIAFSADFITGNSIVVTINGTAVTAVPFNTNHSTTMDDLKAQIETDISTAIATIDASDGNGRTILIDLNNGVAAASVVITGGASQPTAAVSTSLTDAYKEAGAWTETQKKIFAYASGLEDIKGSGSDDIASFMEGQNYDRTISMYHIASQGNQTPAWMESGWPGETLPFDPGSQTWAYKTIAGLAAYELTSAERTNVIGKSCNIYTEVAGVSVTEEGKVASGEWIDIIRGLDDLESSLQETIFSELINVRKVPYTDGGVTMIAGLVESVLNEKAGSGLLVKDSIVVTAPLVADISSTDKTNRLLPDIDFTATLQGAIHKSQINGVVSV